MRIAASDARWNGIRFPEGWKPEDSASCEGALGQAFNLALNCATLLVSSPTSASWESQSLAAPIRLEIRSGSSTQLTARYKSSFFLIDGTWKAGTPIQRLRLPVFDTRPWVASLLREALIAKGIRVVPGPLRFGGISRELVFHSEPLSELLKPFLKNSINMMGDSFLKTLAANSSEPNVGQIGRAHV